MNFIDYCISTKNFSALSAISDYTKTFGKTNPDIKDPYRHMLAKRLNEVRKAVHSRYEKGFDDDGERLKDKKDGMSKAYRDEGANSISEMYRISARKPYKLAFGKTLLRPYKGKYNEE